MRVVSRSRTLFADAQRLLPGGVDSPVRAFRAVGGDPLFIARGEGPYLIDVDDNRYVDFMMSWGPLILGHAYPDVIRAIGEAASRGTSFGAPSPLEVELARLVQQFFPALEMMRFVSSGTEATMSALRLARAFTGRTLILKFEGCYHGHADLLLVTGPVSRSWVGSSRATCPAAPVSHTPSSSSTARSYSKKSTGMTSCAGGVTSPGLSLLASE